MNYLGHFHLAVHTNTSVTGALLGDIVKGRQWRVHSTEVQRGILLHRKIDAFVDQHVRVKLLLDAFPNGQRRLAAIVIDVFFDHYLSQSWTEFSNTPIQDFAAQVYQQLHAYPDLPDNAATLVERMSKGNWLLGYADWQYCHDAVKYMERRFRRPVNFDATLATAKTLNPQMRETFATLYPELLRFSQEQAYSFDV